MTTKDKKANLKKSQKVAEKAIWLEGALVASKIIAAVLSGSLALVSDAIHSASDILTIVTSWIGLKIAQKDPDEKFPYGYYKAESLGSLVISGIIIYAGWEMLTRGISSLTTPSEISLPLVALGVSLVDAIVLFFFGNYEIKIGQETGAQSLIAMGKENRTHIFSSTAVFVGTLSAYFNIPYVEGVITVGISGLIFQIGFESLRNSAFTLMDVSPDKEVESKIRQTLNEVPGIEEYFDLKLRKSGPSIFGEVKVGIRRDVEVNRSHQIADRVETAIKQAVPAVDRMNVHVEPFRSEYRHLVIPVQQKDGLASAVSQQFARSPYFLFVNLKGDEVKGYYFLENPFKEKQKRAGLAVAKLLAEKKSDVVITPEVGEIAFHALREYLFDVYQAEEGSAQEIIDMFKQNKLKQLTEATTQAGLKSKTNKNIIG